MRPLLALSVLAFAFALDAGNGARAQWCAFYDPYTYNCGFRTFQQCLETISGVGGMCRRDPRGPEADERVRERERDPRTRERLYR
jgi:hypothetical protein